MFKIPKKMKVFFDGCETLLKAKIVLWLYKSEGEWSFGGEKILPSTGLQAESMIHSIFSTSEENLTPYQLSHSSIWLNDNFLFAPVRIYNFSQLYECDNSWIDLCCLQVLGSVTWDYTSQIFLTSFLWREPSLPLSSLGFYLSGHVGAFQTFSSTPVGWSFCIYNCSASVVYKLLLKAWIL